MAPGNQKVLGCQGHEYEQARLGICNRLRKLELGLEERFLHPGWNRLGEQRDYSPRQESVVHLSGEKAAVTGSRACRQQL